MSRCMRRRYPLDESLLATSPVHIEREDPIVVASLKLGNLLGDMGFKIDFDYPKIADILGQALPEEEVKRTTVTFVTDAHFAGRYRSGIIKKKPEHTLHNIAINFGTKEFWQNGAGTAATIAHEAQHARDFSKLGHKNAYLRYRAWSIGVCVAATEIGVFWPALLGKSPIFLEENAPPLKVGLATTMAIISAVTGTAGAYLSNPQERRARRAEEPYSKDASIAVIAGLLYHDR